MLQSDETAGRVNVRIGERVPDENAMKVQCGQCPAKYAVSDERIQDKKVRIHCKRCGAAIVVDGKVDPPLVTSTPARKSARPTSPSGPPDSVPPPGEREPDSRPSPRPVAHTIMGGLEAPVGERVPNRRSTPPPRPPRGFAEGAGAGLAHMPAQHRGLTDPPPGADETRWRVALTKQDLRWMTTREIIEAYHAGAVKLETFVFRTGMPTWVTLLEVPEIAEALAEAGEDTGAGPSSLPPPASASSLPPPRVGERAEAETFSLDDLELAEPTFALVAERANGTSSHSASSAEIIETLSDDEIRTTTAPDPPVEPSAPPVPLTEEASQAPLDMPANMPFAAAQQADGSSRWVWVAVAVLLIGAAVAFLAPRLGLF